MAVTTIFAEQEISGFVYKSAFGAYHESVTPAPFTLTDGVTYTVIWDGTEFECTAIAFDYNGALMVAIGNNALAGGENTGEPFGIGYNPSTDYINFFALTEGESHTVAIYQAVAEEAKLIIKDPTGSDCAYPMKGKLRLNTSDGSKVIYSKGEAVENVPVTLDFSNGDQTVTAADGQFIKSAVIAKPETLVSENIAKDVVVAGITGTLETDTEEVTVELSMTDGNQVILPTTDEKAMSKVTVQKPATLIPENIAEGVDIGGIIGTLVSSSGGNVNIAFGTFKGTGGTYVVTHNLGVYPDIFIAYCASTAGNTSGDGLPVALGLSSAFASKCSTNYGTWGVIPYSSTAVTIERGSGHLDAMGNIRVISATTENTITVGSTFCKLLSSSYTYTWFAIAGLV